MNKTVMTALGTALLGIPLLASVPAHAAIPAGDVPASQRAVGWVSCDDGPDEFLTVQPVRHVLSCADANSGLRRLTWSSWTSTAATGSGVYYWNDCEPSCAAGTDYSSKATVTLSRVRIQNGEPVFTRVVVTYTDQNGVKQVDSMTSLPWLG